MHPLASIIGPLNVLISCARQALEIEPGTELYEAQERSAVRAWERLSAQASRLVQGQPKHRKAVRTILDAVERAEECLRSIRLRETPDELMRVTNAAQRAAIRLTDLGTISGQRSESSNEVMVHQRPLAEFLNVSNAVHSGFSGESIQNERRDEPTAVAPLSAGDEHPLSTQ